MQNVLKWMIDFPQGFLETMNTLVETITTPIRYLPGMDWFPEVETTVPLFVDYSIFELIVGVGFKVVIAYTVIKWIIPILK